MTCPQATLKAHIGIARRRRHPAHQSRRGNAGLLGDLDQQLAYGQLRLRQNLPQSNGQRDVRQQADADQVVLSQLGQGTQDSHRDPSRKGSGLSYHARSQSRVHAATWSRHSRREKVWLASG